MDAVSQSQVPGIDGNDLLDEAVNTFQAILVEEPNLNRVRLELAHAYYLQGKDRLAKEHFERVLAFNPPLPVVININRFLNQIRSRKRWEAQFGFALAPDTNIGASSDSSTLVIPVFGIDQEFKRDGSISSGGGFRVWTGGEYQHPINENTRLRIGGGISRTEYKGDRFDSMNLTTHVGPRWLLSSQSELSLLAVAKHTWQSKEPEYLDLGVRIETGHRLNEKTTLTTRTSLLNRRHDRDSLLRGQVSNLSFGIKHVLTPTLRVNASVGLSRTELKSARNSNRGRSVNVGLTNLLEGGLSIGGSFGIQWDDWGGDWFPEVRHGGSRKDTIRTLGLSVHHRGFTILNFSPQLSLTREIRDSNSQIHDYRKVVGEVSFVRPF